MCTRAPKANTSNLYIAPNVIGKKLLWCHCVCEKPQMFRQCPIAAVAGVRNRQLRFIYGSAKSQAEKRNTKLWILIWATFFHIFISLCRKYGHSSHLWTTANRMQCKAAQRRPTDIEQLHCSIATADSNLNRALNCAMFYTRSTSLCKKPCRQKAAEMNRSICVIT